MKNKDRAMALFNSKQKRGNSVQSRMVKWLLENDNEAWKVSDMVKMFNTKHRTVSSAIKNTENQLGFVYRKIKKHSKCNHERTYILVDCQPDGVQEVSQESLINSIFR